MSSAYSRSSSEFFHFHAVPLILAFITLFKILSRPVETRKEIGDNPP
jgi:hypothetical protein